MQKLKKSFLYSWLDPKGYFHEVPMMGHYDFAFDYLEDVEKLDDGYILDKNAMDLFFDRGWFRVVHNDKEKTLYVGGVKTYPNNKQLRNLKDLALNFGYNKILFRNRMIDQKGLKDKILWRENSNLITFGELFYEKETI